MPNSEQGSPIATLYTLYCGFDNSYDKPDSQTTWSRTAPTDKEYIWFKTHITYEDGTSLQSDPQLDDGSIRIVRIYDEYLGTETDTPPTHDTQGWSETMPTSTYIWTRKVTEYSNGQKEYGDIKLYNDGESEEEPEEPESKTDEAELVIVSVENQYFGTNDESVVPDGSSTWSETTPETYRYLWVRTKTTYEDGSIVYSEPSRDISDDEWTDEGSDTPPAPPVDEPEYNPPEAPVVDDEDPEINIEEGDEPPGEYIQQQEIIIDYVEAQEEIFNKLTNNGTAEGLFFAEDEHGVKQLYVNMSFARTGILQLGGPGNEFGVAQILDQEGNVISQWDKTGLTSYAVYINGGEGLKSYVNIPTENYIVNAVVENISNIYGDSRDNYKNGLLESEFLYSKYYFKGGFNNRVVDIELEDTDNTKYSYIKKAMLQYSIINIPAQLFDYKLNTRDASYEESLVVSENLYFGFSIVPKNGSFTNLTLKISVNIAYMEEGDDSPLTEEALINNKSFTVSYNSSNNYYIKLASHNDIYYSGYDESWGIVVTRLNLYLENVDSDSQDLELLFYAPYVGEYAGGITNGFWNCGFADKTISYINHTEEAGYINISEQGFDIYVPQQGDYFYKIEMGLSKTKEKDIEKYIIDMDPFEFDYGPITFSTTEISGINLEKYNDESYYQNRIEPDFIHLSDAELNASIITPGKVSLIKYISSSAGVLSKRLLNFFPENKGTLEYEYYERSTRMEHISISLGDILTTNGGTITGTLNINGLLSANDVDINGVLDIDVTDLSSSTMVVSDIAYSDNYIKFTGIDEYSGRNDYGYLRYFWDDFNFKGIELAVMCDGPEGETWDPNWIRFGTNIEDGDATVQMSELFKAPFQNALGLTTSSSYLLTGTSALLKMTSFGTELWSLPTKSLYANNRYNNNISFSGVVVGGHITSSNKSAVFFIPYMVIGGTPKVTDLSLGIRGGSGQEYLYMAYGSSNNTYKQLQSNPVSIWANSKTVDVNGVASITCAVKVRQGFLITVNFTNTLRKSASTTVCQNNAPYSFTVTGKITLS